MPTSRLGGRPPPPAPEDAATRAAKAAAKVESPPRDAERKVKLKTVSWANEKNLVSVRYFRRVCPCAFKDVNVITPKR